MSKEFSELTALILNANGIKTYIFEALRPVPELSFAVRYLGCVAGVMITASHNPPEYNGYKVYWDDGSQIVPPVDGEIIDEVNSTKFGSIKTIDKNEAIEKGLYNTILEEVDEAFSNKLKSLVINKDAIETCEDLKIVYTPLHGTGGEVTPKLLREIGFKNVYVVSSGSGLEALIAGCEVTCYGEPFYSGYGLTIDKKNTVRNRRMNKIGSCISLDLLIYSIFFKYSIFIDPIQKKQISPIEAIHNIINILKPKRYS